MKSLFLKIGLLAIVVCGFTYSANADTTLKTEWDSISYAIGMNYVRMVQNNDLQLNFDVFCQGIKDAASKQNLKLTEEQEQAILQRLDNMMREKQMEAQKQQQEEDAKIAKANKEKGAAFMADNAKKKGVKTTASGLQYEVVQEGKGKVPTATSKVRVHYTGTLIDGTKFDSSVDRGEPIEFPLNGVIKGWTEGLQLCKEGGKIRLWIPSDLGYGDRSAGQIIQPGSTLIFDVELIKIVE